ncbi:hypothetical protein [Shouchella patagoniensis]|uniref:hypothetical protein n=1 Tax=Shouchella patagoniensis TaxID=228576 RepID=UPI000994B09E|nr:hypothetical protein [Shouchella patagoniensis]
MGPTSQPALLKQISLFVLLFAVIWFTITINGFEETVQLEIQVVESDVKKGQTVDLQVFIVTDKGVGYDQAMVAGSLSKDNQFVEILFHHIENGLYEGEARFDMTGVWEGEVEAKSFSARASSKIELVVE